MFDIFYPILLDNVIVTAIVVLKKYSYKTRFALFLTDNLEAVSAIWLRLIMYE